MRVLALDSATNVASCAVVNEDKILAEFTLNTSKTHSERLMPLVSEALEYADFTLEDIDGFSVSIGPGSFTGLRIGLATIKALAFFTGKPLVGVCTLDGLAANLPHIDGLICPILKARKDELYCALYLNAASGQERISEYMVLSPKKLVAFLAKLEAARITFLGDGTGMLPAHLEGVLGPGCTTASRLHCFPRAASIGFLGLEKLKNGEHDDINSLSPFYIKASAAEERLRRKIMTCEGEGNG